MAEFTEREHRFRVWHKTFKYFLRPDQLDASIVDVISHEDGFSLDDREVIYLAWTGLLDRHGRKIFEGDIVQQTHVYSGPMVGDVQYHAELGSACGWKCGPIFYLSSMQKEILILGNIFENPELLERN